MGQLVSNARAPIFNSRRQQNPPNAAVALDSVFSNRPISVAYVRSDTTSRSHSHSRRRSVLRRPARSEAASRRTSASHRSRRFSIFLARPVYPTLRRAGPSIVVCISLTRAIFSHILTICFCSTPTLRHPYPKMRATGMTTTHAIVMFAVIIST